MYLKIHGHTCYLELHAIMMSQSINFDPFFSFSNRFLEQQLQRKGNGFRRPTTDSSSELNFSFIQFMDLASYICACKKLLYCCLFLYLSSIWRDQRYTFVSTIIVLLNIVCINNHAGKRSAGLKRTTPTLATGKPSAQQPRM
jgi:hypothetical protein